MSNVLTDLAPDIYKSADIVGQNIKGLVTSIVINGDASERVAFGDAVRSPVTQAPQVNTTHTPSMTIPEGDDQEVATRALIVDKVANVKIPWTGEDIKHVNNGPGFETIYGDQIRQAMNAIGNKIEKDVWTEAYKSASRAVGTAGTTPFASDFKDVARIRQILIDNGMPDDGMASMVMDTYAGTNLRNLAQLQKANEAGGAELLRSGVLLDLQGLMMKESSQIGTHTKGTGAGHLVNSVGGLEAGTKVIPVDTGTGTIVAGDVVTFDGDADNKYVVEAALSGGSFTIADPGLRVDIANDAAVTVLNSYTASLATHRNAIELVMRPPAQPRGGDAAVDRMTVQDPFSGLVYEIAAYRGYNKAMFDITCLYGVKAWIPKFIALLLG